MHFDIFQIDNYRRQRSQIYFHLLMVRIGMKGTLGTLFIVCRGYASLYNSRPSGQPLILHNEVFLPLLT